jgi:hypothetical protein
MNCPHCQRAITEGLTLYIGNSMQHDPDTQTCPSCKRPTVEIDHYGELLIGCIECNRWGCPGDKMLVMELLEADLERLRKARASVRCSARNP